MKNKKRLLILLICSVAAAILVLIAVYASKNDSDNHAGGNREALDSFIEIQIGKFERQCALGSDSTYPDFWYEVNLGELTGKSNTANVESAKEQIIETEAICYYAEKNNIIVTDDEIQERIKDIVSEGREADNYKEIETACESAGTSFDEIINKNKSFCAKQMYTDKVYSDAYDKYYENESRSSESKDKVLNWDKEWKSVKKRIVESFKETGRYTTLKTALDKDCKILKNENDKAFKEDIKISWYTRADQ